MLFLIAVFAAGILLGLYGDYMSWRAAIIFVCSLLLTIFAFSRFGLVGSYWYTIVFVVFDIWIIIYLKLNGLDL